MNHFLIRGSIAAVLMITACKRPAGSTSSSATPASSSSSSSDAAVEAPVAPEVKPPAGTENDSDVVRARQEEFALQLESAQASFKKRLIPATLVKLEEVAVEFRSDPKFLNLRACCHVERKDFESALKDFQEAAKKSPGDNEIRFNIAEMHFVSERWDDAIREFKLVNPPPGQNGELLRALIDFKLMLCEEGRGNAAEFDRLAAENLKSADTLLAAYTKAAMEFREGAKEQAKVTLADAGKRFPEASDRAPWHDTMIEFGYDPR